jgi:pSer/pThr/pTyr-binding forkhead associated (FHA) protein
MDWNVILFAARWAIIALFYAVLLVLLAGVYREASARLGQRPAAQALTYGRLRVLHPGSDPHLTAGSILNLKAVSNLGSSQENDIQLRDQFVSGRHFRLRWDGAAWWLEDLNSKNGTLVNRQPVKPGRPQILPSGAVIGVGDMALEIIE